jgi:hypothetical protein
VNLSYDDYLKSFYPNQEENVFTHNNWTLSTEVIETLQSNFFYKQHVRWNIQRYGPCDIICNVENQLETVVTPERRSASENQQAISQQQLMINNVQNEEVNYTCSFSTRSKRKVGPNDDFYESQTRTQPRRMKKN